AERYGDNPFHYTVSNAVTEGIIVSGLLSSLVNFNAGVGLGVMYCAFNTVIRAIAASESKTEKAAGSILIGVPFYVTLYSILAVKAIKNGITDAYSSALQEEKQKSRDKKIIKTVPVRPTLPDSYEPSQINIRVSISSDFAGIEESKPEVVDEEFEEEESEEARRKRLLNMDI
ncbi:MAG: hypothetical protein Q7S55_02415, partial [Nanoarchaeota archaeon]|nr:hypothetical protein [Nanoarchaeota archaeon]